MSSICEKDIAFLSDSLNAYCYFSDHYLLFDFPGQVELFFLHSSAKAVIMKLIKKLNLRVCSIIVASLNSYILV